MPRYSVTLAVAAFTFALTAGAVRAKVIEIKIANVAFMPALIAAHVGDTLEWINADIVAHTATARNGAWDILIAPDTKKSIVLKSAGTVEHYCKFHPNMVGQIAVVE